MAKNRRNPEQISDKELQSLISNKTRAKLARGGFRTKKEAVTYYYNKINKTLDLKNPDNQKKKIKVLISKKEIEKTLKGIKKTKTGYSRQTSFRRIEKKVDNLKLDPKSIKKLKSSLSQAEYLKARQKAIFSSDFTDNPIFRQNYNNLLKISRLAEQNRYDLLVNTKIFTDSNGRKYTIKQLTNLKKDFVKKTQNLIIDLDPDYLAYLANARNLKKVIDLVQERFYNENFTLGKFGFDFSKLNFRENKKKLREEIDKIQATYFDKTGQKGEHYTKYFTLKIEYIGSDELKVTGIDFKNEIALTAIEQETLFYGKKIFVKRFYNDLLPYEGLYDGLVSVFNNTYEYGRQKLENFDDIRPDLEKITNTIKKILEKRR